MSLDCLMSLTNLVFFVISVTETFIKFLILYKFCFYVDLICICLKNLLEILNQIPLYSHNKQLVLHKIYQIKKSYTFIVEMTDELNNFMSITISVFTVNEMLWILRVVYISICAYMDNEEIGAGKVFGKVTDNF